MPRFEPIRQWSREWHSLSADVKARIEAHLGKAPVRVSAICANFGVPVTLVPLAARISGEIRPDPESPSGFKIRINRFENENRQRFTAAHELAHYLLHPDRIGDGIVDSVLYRSKLSNQIEAQANRLAADILMPYTLLRHYISGLRHDDFSPDDLVVLAESFKVSEVALRFRLGM